MRTLALLLTLAPWACAQLDDNTITINASRNVVAAPDLMTITVSSIHVFVPTSTYIKWDLQSKLRGSSGNNSTPTLPIRPNQPIK